MSNLAGMMRRLFANTAPLPMDSCPVIRWASWVARVTQVAHAAGAPRQKRLGYETSGACGARFQHAAGIVAARRTQAVQGRGDAADARAPRHAGDASTETRSRFQPGVTLHR
ncbi:hypothetical protein [Burkholderia sp. BCC1977]|uniref:hypothetical protein n=1 Tax=Burkholderia sp. BCC1977 TaxID=2817440 RepID=UPI002ABD2BE0|nr:hypothetical protein [Burkholderia sp. BCC1977]